MKKFSLLISGFWLMALLVSCEDGWSLKPENDNQTNELYTPWLQGLRADGQVTLKWGKPICPYVGGRDCPSGEPRQFEIWIAEEEPSRFRLHSKENGNVFEATLENLKNGTPYYLKVKAVKGLWQTQSSNMIMVIPEPAENIVPLFPTLPSSNLTLADSRKAGSWSPDHSLVAYVSEYVTNNGNNGIQSVFIAPMADSEPFLVERASSLPEWSPVAPKLVYHTENLEENRSPGPPISHIATFDYQDSTIERLTTAQAFNYMPSWSPDGRWIVYLSDAGGGTEFNLWKVPAEGGAPIQLTTDFGDLDDLALRPDRSATHPAWSRDGSKIAFARLKKQGDRYVSDIYTVSAAGAEGEGWEDLVSSPWDDLGPTYSPDGSEIAFISNRSGSYQIWTMDLQTQRIRQITGSQARGVYHVGGQIEWSTSGDKFIFTSSVDNGRGLFTVDAR